MTSLVLSALPFALAIDFFTTTDKKRPRPCEARAHDHSRRDHE